MRGVKNFIDTCFSLDSEFCELLERLETDQEFSEQFHQDVEEIKQIRIPLEVEETEELFKGR